MPAAPVNVFAIARPFLLLAVVAFFAGFGGYLILGHPDEFFARGTTPALATEPADVVSAPVSRDWNFPKKI